MDRFQDSLDSQDRVMSRNFASIMVSDHLQELVASLSANTINLVEQNKETGDISCLKKIASQNNIRLGVSFDLVTGLTHLQLSLSCVSHFNFFGPNLAIF